MPNSILILRRGMLFGFWPLIPFRIAIGHKLILPSEDEVLSSRVADSILPRMRAKFPPGLEIYVQSEE